MKTIICRIEYSQNEFKEKKGINIKQKFKKNETKNIKINKFKNSPIKEISIPQSGIISKKLFEANKSLTKKKYRKIE